MRGGATIFFEIFSISNTINVNNAIKNIPAVNSNINVSLLMCITLPSTRGKVIPVARIQLLNCTLGLYHNYVDYIQKNKMVKPHLVQIRRTVSQVNTVFTVYFN